MPPSPPPLVLLHGFTGSPASWDAVVSHLPGRAVLRPALLGHAPDARPPAHGGDFAGEVERLLGLLGAGPYHLSGYSLGARVAMGLLCRDPGRFCRATLIGGHPGLRAPEERRQRALADEAWVQLLLREGVAAFTRAWEAQPLFAPQTRLPAAARERQRALRLGHDPAALAAALRALSLARMPDLWPRLPALDLPVDLLVGAEDGKFLAVLQGMARALPRARLRVVPGAGHNLPLEAPAAVAEALGPWPASGP